MIPGEKKQTRVKLSIFLSIALSVAVILLIFYYTFDPKSFQNLSLVEIRYLFFIAAILANFLFWILWGARLKILSNAIEPTVHISLWESTKIVFANLFLAGITPSLAGGEPVRIYLLNKDGLNVGEATAAVLGERLIDAIFLLACVPFAVYIFKDRIHVEAISIGLTIAVIVFILFILVFLYVIKNPEKTKACLLFLNNKFSRLFKKKEASNVLIQKIHCEVDHFHASMVFFLTSGKKAFISAGLLTILMWATGFMIPSLILLGLGLPPFILDSCAAQVFLIVIGMMPLTPGSSGVTEISAAGLYSVIIGSSLLGVFVILFRIITYHMGLIVGAIFQYRIFKSLTSFSLEAIEKHAEHKKE